MKPRRRGQRPVQAVAACSAALRKDSSSPRLAATCRPGAGHDLDQHRLAAAVRERQSLCCPPPLSPRTHATSCPSRPITVQHTHASHPYRCLRLGVLVLVHRQVGLGPGAGLPHLLHHGLHIPHALLDLRLVG